MFMRLPRSLRRYRFRRLAVLRSMPLNSAPNSCAVISRRRFVLFTERHRVGAFLQPLGPHREPVAIPVQNLHPVPRRLAKTEKMPGKRIQLHRAGDQRVQSVEASPHVARRGAQVHAHARRQVDHAGSRSTASTNLSVAASARNPQAGHRWPASIPWAVPFPLPALSPPERSGPACSVSAASHATHRRRTPSTLAHGNMRGPTGRSFPAPRFSGAIVRAVALAWCSPLHYAPHSWAGIVGFM